MAAERRVASPSGTGGFDHLPKAQMGTDGVAISAGSKAPPERGPSGTGHQADAVVAAVLVTNLGLSEEQAVAEVMRLKASGPSGTGHDTAVSDFCECGHPRHEHVRFERVGACHGKRDTRPVTVGGPELTPCVCKQFKPLGWTNA